MLRGRIAAIHRAANPALGEDEAAAAVVIVNQVMKMIRALAATEDQPAERLVGEARKLMAQYIAEVLERPSAAPPSLGTQSALGRGLAERACPPRQTLSRKRRFRRLASVRPPESVRTDHVLRIMVLDFWKIRLSSGSPNHGAFDHDPSAHIFPERDQQLSCQRHDRRLPPRTPEARRWDRLKRAMTRVDQHSAGAGPIPRRISRGRNRPHRPHHLRLCRIPTAECHSLWLKNSLRAQASGNVVTPEKEAMRCTAWAVFIVAKPLLYRVGRLATATAQCVSIRTPDIEV